MGGGARGVELAVGLESLAEDHRLEEGLEAPVVDRWVEGGVELHEMSLRVEEVEDAVEGHHPRHARVLALQGGVEVVVGGAPQEGGEIPPRRLAGEEDALRVAAVL